MDEAEIVDDISRDLNMSQLSYRLCPMLCNLGRDPRLPAAHPPNAANAKKLKDSPCPSCLQSPPGSTMPPRSLHLYPPGSRPFRSIVLQPLCRLAPPIRCGSSWQARKSQGQVHPLRHHPSSCR